MPANYDVDEVINQFLHGGMESDRRELMREFTDAMRSSNRSKELVIEIGHHAQTNGLRPTDMIALGVIYGMSLGVLMEKERAARRKRVEIV